jgi:hypothetical protein
MPRLTTLHITGLGPHAAPLPLALPAAPVAELAGPSQAGKSTTLLALCLLLTGQAPDGSAFPVELLNDTVDDADARISAVLADGSALARTMTLSRSSTWKTASPPQVPADPKSRIVTSLQSQAAWQASLGIDADLTRAILCPGEALALTRQARGRPLRDLLLSVLPPVDVRAIVAQWVGGLTEDEAHVEEDVGKGKARVMGAKSRLTAANKAAAEAAGASAEASNALDATRAARPTEGPAQGLDALKVKADAAQLWLAQADAYASTVADHALQHRYTEAAQRAHDEAQARAAAWDSRAAEVSIPDHPGEMPSASAQAGERVRRAGVLEAAQASLAVAQSRAWEAARWSDPMVSQRRASLTLAVEAADRAAAGPTDGDCPTCGQQVSAEHAAAHQARAVEAVAQARAALELVEAEQAREREQRVARARGVVEAAEASLDEARAALAAADADLEAAKAAQAQHQVLLNQRAAAIAAQKALGPRPTVPSAPEPVPPLTLTPPAHWGDDHGAATRARASASVAAYAAAQARQAGSALAAWEAQVAAAEQRLAAAQTRSIAAQAAAARAERVLDAVRRAPTEAAARSSAALGQVLPPSSGVSIRWGGPEEGGPEVEVLIDGRPWWCASSGRQVVADLELRLALRRLAVARTAGASLRSGALLTYADVPVVVDRAQDWSGAWPSLRPGEGSVLLIRTVSHTTPGPAIRVSAHTTTSARS